MSAQRDQFIDDLATIRWSVNNARANLAVAIDAAQRPGNGRWIGDRLVMQDRYTGVNAFAKLREAHACLVMLERIWQGVEAPDTQA